MVSIVEGALELEAGDLHGAGDLNSTAYQPSDLRPETISLPLFLYLANRNTLLSSPTCLSAKRMK